MRDYNSIKNPKLYWLLLNSCRHLTNKHQDQKQLWIYTMKKIKLVTLKIRKNIISQLI